MLQSQDLRVGQEKEPCIRFTQGNSIESSVQNYLPYILLAHGLCPTTLACTNWPYVYLRVNIYYICCIILLY